MAKPSLPEALIIDEVKEAIVLALGVDEEDLDLDASLMDDFGAESLDYLDIAFRLERQFDIRIPRQNMMEKASEQYGEERFFNDGVFTEDGLSLLKLAMPEVEDKLVEGMTEEDIPAIITARTWIRIVDTILSELPETCPNCGSDDIVIFEEKKFQCNQCKERVYPASGDEVFMKHLPMLMEKVTESK